jgi:prepilin-type N-terminal cleavage/methylation domain-containing protein/prepilin-type processing-associated H-X9-DG protein
MRPLVFPSCSGRHRRRAFTLIELLVVIAIIGVLVGLLLPAIQKVRAAAQATKCKNNLKQLGLAAQNYCSQNEAFPFGLSPAPARSSCIFALLPFLEQQNRYTTFDLTKDVTTDPANFSGRVGDISVLLCPADPSVGMIDAAGTPPSGQASGRCNYYGNLGAHAWTKDVSGSISKDPALRGVFGDRPGTRMADIIDGTSNTAIFAEVKRGAAPTHDALDVTVLMPPQWDKSGTNTATNPNNLSPPAACNTPPATPAPQNYTGLQFFRGAFNSTLYTHTVPPNYTGRDCLRFPSADQGHLAARSYHSGGVHIARVDGSVQFIPQTIDPAVWKGLGTIAGNEIGDGDS